MTDRSADVPESIEPHWWAIIFAAVTGFLGWRMKSAQDAVRIENAVREIDRIAERVRVLEGSTTTTVATLASISTSLESIGKTLTRLENKIDGKADK